MIGEILLAHVADAVLTEGRVDILKLRPAARLGGANYARLGEIMERIEPWLREWAGV